MNPHQLQPISDEQAQQAVEELNKHPSKAAAARALGLSREGFRHRLAVAEKRGIRSAASVIPASGFPLALRHNLTQPSWSVGRKHMVIPDGQNKKGVPMNHWTAIGNYMVEKKPDVVVNLADFWDMHSLSTYDRKKKSAEGRRYIDDIEAGQYAMRLLMTPLVEYNKRNPQSPYHPELHFTTGNHEERILRYIEENAELEGALGYKDLGLEKWGWIVHPFLQPVNIDGVVYAHYFISGQKGLPVTSARALATKKHMSCTMGHSQKTDIDMSQVRADGKRIIALFAGCCYQHNEDYLGPQGNADRRQIVMCHEVQDGDYDPMFVSLKYLLRRYQ